MHFRDGSVYDGTWKHGQKHGRGELICANGLRYKGTWVNDVVEGEIGGTHVFSWVLHGRLSNTGKGELTYPDGSKYEGSFREQRRDGRGTYLFPDGQQYSGRWVSDAMEHNGIVAVIYFKMQQHLSVLLQLLVRC
jgi:hypothetical protein